jgi:hypothetical protein
MHKGGRHLQLLQRLPPKRLIRGHEPLDAHEPRVLVHTAHLERAQHRLHVVPPVRGLAEHLHHARQLRWLGPSLTAYEKLIDEFLLGRGSGGGEGTAKSIAGVVVDVGNGDADVGVFAPKEEDSAVVD